MCLMYHMCGTQTMCLEGPRAVLGAMQHLLGNIYWMQHLLDATSIGCNRQHLAGNKHTLETVHSPFVGRPLSVSATACKV